MYSIHNLLRRTCTAAILFSSLFAQAQIKIEAEEYSSVSNGATPVILENSGASIGYFDEKGELLTYSVSVAQAGYYELSMKYLSGEFGTVAISNGSGDVGYIEYEPTLSDKWWETPIANWPKTHADKSPLFYLVAGTQNITVHNTGKSINLDYIEMTPSSATNTSISMVTTSPERISVMPEKSVQISAYGLTSDNRTVAAPIVWSSNAPDGLFTAGSSTGIEQVTVRVGGMEKLLNVKISLPGKKRNYVVSQFGRLSVKESVSGANDWAVRGENGQKASLAGPSFFWSGSAGTWWTRETVDWLVDDWHVQVIRCPVSIAPGYWENSAPFGSYSPVKIGKTWNTNDYFNNPELAKKMMDEMVAAAIENDIYVIIDFHDHHSQFWKQQAIEFFDYFSKKWGSYPNVLYEIFNEPFVNEQVNQDGYADAVCQTIRANDKSNVIIIGSKNYSRDPDFGASFYKHGNIAGTWHGYVVNNHQADWAANPHWNNGTGVVVTEWGRDGGSDGGLVQTFKNAGVIQCSWAINNKQVDGDENWSTFNAGMTKVSGWTDADLAAPGKWMRSMMRGYGYIPPAKSDPDLVELTVIDNQIVRLPATSIELWANATTGFGTLQYSWTQIEGAAATISSATIANPTISKLSIGMYRFKLTVTNGIDIQERIISLTVVPQHYSIPANGALIDNVADNNTTSLWGGRWSMFDDHKDLGASSITPAEQLPAHETIRAEYTLNKGSWTYDPYCGIRVSLRDNGTAYDLSQCTKISYKFKGPAHDFRAEMSSVSDGDFHKTAVEASAIWKTATIDWSSLAQDPSWGTDVGEINKTMITNFSWQVSAPSGAGTLEIDDLMCMDAQGPIGSNLPPVVFAGIDQSCDMTKTELDGSLSYDSKGSALTFLWTQLSGPSSATLTSAQMAKTEAVNLQNGEYTFVLQADNGTMQNTDTVSIVVNISNTTVTLALNAGWNLLSAHVIPGNKAIQSVFPQATEVKSRQGFYKRTQAAYLNSLTTFTAGEAYLVYNTVSEEIIISGTATTNHTTDLHTGWNYVGVPVAQSKSVTSLPAQIVTIKDFDEYYLATDSRGNLSVLEPGKGYFMYAQGPCTINW